MTSRLRNGAANIGLWPQQFADDYSAVKDYFFELLRLRFDVLLSKKTSGTFGTQLAP